MGKPLQVPGAWWSGLVTKISTATPPPHRIANGIIAIGLKFQEVLPGVQVLLAGLLPRDEGYSIRRDRQHDVNTALRLHCQRSTSRGSTTSPLMSALHQGLMAFWTGPCTKLTCSTSVREAMTFMRGVFLREFVVLYIGMGRGVGKTPHLTPLQSACPRASEPSPPSSGLSSIPHG